MRSYPDLTLVAPSPWIGLTAFYVGWLSKSTPFTKGPTPPGFLERLLEFGDLGTYMVSGLDPCTFCEDVVRANSTQELLGQGHILVQWRNQWYYAPNLIIHYIEAHQYLPPAPFIQAALESPAPSSLEHKLAMLDLFASDRYLSPGQAPWLVPFAETQALWKLRSDKFSSPKP